MIFLKLIRKSYIIVGFLLLGMLPVFSQQSNTLTPADSSFTMKVSREKGEIFISLSFAPTFVFDYVAVERRSDIDQSYTQCKYIDFAEVIKNQRHLVKKDNYPYPGASPVLYRLKVVAKDGTERAYPPLLLPSVKQN